MSKTFTKKEHVWLEMAALGSLSTLLLSIQLFQLNAGAIQVLSGTLAAIIFLTGVSHGRALWKEPLAVVSLSLFCAPWDTFHPTALTIATFVLCWYGYETFFKRAFWGPTLLMPILVIGALCLTLFGSAPAASGLFFLGAASGLSSAVFLSSQSRRTKQAEVGSLV